MRYCPNCGREISKNNKFCPYCGTKLTNFSAFTQHNNQNDSPNAVSTPVKNTKITGPLSILVTLFLNIIGIGLMILDMYYPYKPRMANYIFVAINIALLVYNIFFYKHYSLSKVLKWVTAIFIVLFIIFTYISIAISIACSM